MVDVNIIVFFFKRSLCDGKEAPSSGCDGDNNDLNDDGDLLDDENDMDAEN